MSRRTTVFDEGVLRAANAAANVAAREFLGNAGRRLGVVLSAPAGAGKTGVVSEVTRRASQQKMRVSVGTPTNEQAFGLVRRLSPVLGKSRITYLPAASISVPDDIRALPNVRIVDSNGAVGAEVLVATIDKLGDAFARQKLHGFDGLILDESFQADSRRYYCVADLAPTHLLVGDGGQLSPFSNYEEADRWRGLPEDPLQTSVGVLLRNHPTTRVQVLPMSRRLDARAVPIARAFYPTLPFGAAVLEGVRELDLSRATASPRERALDAALEHAAASGWAHLELPAAPVLRIDPGSIELLVALVRRLFARKPRVRCEREQSKAALRQSRIAVGVSHNDQKDLLRVALDNKGFSGVVVETANKLQGLEFDVVFAWHPLAGMVDADEFHLDPGRLCVL